MTRAHIVLSETGRSDRPHASFPDFYRKSYSRLVGQVYTVVGDMCDAEDLCQDAFLEASRRWEDISGYDNPEAWVRRAALNRAVNLRRRAGRKRRALYRLAGGLSHAPAADEAATPELTSALSGIPLRYRMVLSLHYLMDLSVADIAQELNLPQSTVKTRLARGRKRLRDQISTREES